MYDEKCRCGDESPTSVITRANFSPPVMPPQKLSNTYGIDARQLHCVRTIFAVYAERVFQGQPPSKLIFSLSREGWLRLCRDLLRGGVAGVHLLPGRQLAQLYMSYAQPRADCFQRADFKVGISFRMLDLNSLHLNFDSFIELLTAVATRWSQMRRRIMPRADQRTALSDMLHEAANSSLHRPECESTIARRQYNKDGSMQTVRLWELLKDDAKGSSTPVGHTTANDSSTEFVSKKIVSKKVTQSKLIH